jgi:hypothetical protein
MTVAAAEQLDMDSGPDAAQTFMGDALRDHRRAVLPSSKVQLCQAYADPPYITHMLWQACGGARPFRQSQLLTQKPQRSLFPTWPVLVSHAAPTEQGDMGPALGATVWQVLVLQPGRPTI